VVVERGEKRGEKGGMDVPFYVFPVVFHDHVDEVVHSR